MSHSDRRPNQRASRAADLPTKVCATCGRTMQWRKAWARNWESVRYCSDACRSRRPGPAGEQLEGVIMTMLGTRAVGASICPSEVARAVAPEDWRSLMEPVRQAARRLVARGEVEITQSGRVIDPSTARGPIRIRRRDGGGGPAVN